MAVHTQESSLAPGYINSPLMLLKIDPLNFAIFVCVNILIGQFGIIGSLWIANSRSNDLSQVIQQNLASGAFVTFAISLLVSSMAIVVVEVVDAARRKQDHVKHIEKKLAWGIVGLFVLLFCTLHAGSLMDAEISAVQHSNDSIATQQPATSGVSSQILSRNDLEARGKKERSGSLNTAQLVLWFLAMLVSLELYCLYRVPNTIVNHAAERTREVDTMTERAASQSETAFGEKV